MFKCPKPKDPGRIARNLKAFNEAKEEKINLSQPISTESEPQVLYTEEYLS